ncbi:transcription antiterminator [Brevibacillus humidisoli]|uniref:glucose PTS transporter transcription antiterminator GlcT n=1 Tax=Brevibacillus humidisoli TaxID=2895522 RepID=UPI001E4F18D9|nr:transcription antiterminator [Brevibacillus humidisoli]UFJ43404.1 transcription antiterminator [Brevibacillus humidisoli]
MSRSYTVQRAFNNNVVLVKEEPRGMEVILLGKGIGFGKKPGHAISIDDERIEKKFRLEDEQHIKQYHHLISQVDQDVIGLSEEIIAMIAKEFAPALNEHVHLALPDHIQFAIQRLQNGMEIVNPFLFEIQTLYPKECALAQRAAERIERDFGVEIPESEVGFLALHIHSAATPFPVSRTVRFTNLIKELVQQVEEQTGTKLQSGSIDYVRLITHLRFAIERINQGKAVQNPLLDRVKTLFPEAYQLAASLTAKISQRLQVEVPEDETGYVAMHLQRLLQMPEA